MKKREKYISTLKDTFGISVGKDDVKQIFNVITEEKTITFLETAERLYIFSNRDVYQFYNIDNALSYTNGIEVSELKKLDDEKKVIQFACLNFEIDPNDIKVEKI